MGALESKSLKSVELVLSTQSDCVWANCRFHPNRLDTSDLNKPALNKPDPTSSYLHPMGCTNQTSDFNCKYQEPKPSQTISPLRQSTSLLKILYALSWRMWVNDLKGLCTHVTNAVRYFNWNIFIWNSYKYLLNMEYVYSYGIFIALMRNKLSFTVIVYIVVCWFLLILGQS